jgi:hypothetical protein
MCRAKRMASIRHAHTMWREDSIAVTLAHMKNDQDGSRLQDPRHVYTNPTMPEIVLCWRWELILLSLGLTRLVNCFPEPTSTVDSSKC